jgi:hypothetical protein
MRFTTSRHPAASTAQRQWLHDFLAGGPQRVKLCHQEGSKLGLARRTPERAAKFESVFVRQDGEWRWRLP